MPYIARSSLSDVGYSLMMDAVRTYRRGLAGALAILLTGTTSAFAQTPLRLSDTITLRHGTCTLVSDATDVEKSPERRGAQRCVFADAPTSLARVSVPGNNDEFIVFEYAIQPDGTIVGKGREGQGPSAYPCTITGKTRPGTKRGGLAERGAVIRVWETPSLP